MVTFDAPVNVLKQSYESLLLNVMIFSLIFICIRAAAHNGVCLTLRLANGRTNFYIAVKSKCHQMWLKTLEILETNASKYIYFFILA